MVCRTSTSVLSTEVLYWQNYMYLEHLHLYVWLYIFKTKKGCCYWQLVSLIYEFSHSNCELGEYFTSLCVRWLFPCVNDEISSFASWMAKSSARVNLLLANVTSSCSRWHGKLLFRVITLSETLLPPRALWMKWDTHMGAMPITNLRGTRVSALLVRA